MDEIIECPKRNCEDDICSPVQSKKRKLNESEPPQTVKLGEKDCFSENTSNCSDDVLKAKLNNCAVVENHNGEKDTNDITKEAPNNTDDSKQKSSATIFSLSNDILLFLLSYINSSDVFHLSRCHQRLFDVCGDKSQWIKVNSDCDGCNPSHDEQALFFHPGTTHLRFVKTKKNDSDLEDSCFKEDFFEHLSDYAPNLQSLIIENHVLNSESFMLKFLPNTITELRLPNVNLLHFFHNTRYFHEIDTILPNLEVVDVSYCQWFNAHALMALGKCNNLKEFRITGCRNMKDFIPYASLATTFGFKKLQTLDLRLTGIVDREIACFNKTKSLKHIYLEKPSDMQNCRHDESVTDICTTSFGRRSCQPDHPSNMVLITRIPMDGGSFTDYTLETLVVRNYPGITDITLKHAQKCLQSLKYLDVTGCSCTSDQAFIFKQNRPEVELIYNGVPI